MSPGELLRTYREQLGFTVRDVESASSKLAQKYGNSDLATCTSCTESISRMSYPIPRP